MPLNLPPDLPAIEVLKREHIFVVNTPLPVSDQGVGSLKLLILNLMPVKQTTETDFVRLLSNSPLPIDITFLKIKSHRCKNTSEEHLTAFYKNFEDIHQEHFDGMIVTGAPVELIDFEDVTYWKELTGIFDWARKHIGSTLYICWGAQAGLYHFYGIPKYPLENKMFGVFKHRSKQPTFPLFRGFDDVFYVPHSRHTEIRKDDIERVPALKILSDSEVSGVYIVMAGEGREFFITGHSEYAPESLHNEYIRDMEKNLPIQIPSNYYIDNDPEKGICVLWKAHANLLFTNWLNYFVYK